MTSLTNNLVITIAVESYRINPVMLFVNDLINWHPGSVCTKLFEPDLSVITPPFFNVQRGGHPMYSPYFVHWDTAVPIYTMGGGPPRMLYIAGATLSNVHSRSR